MLLFTAVGLLCLLLHTANGSLNTTRLAPSQSASNQANYSSSASLAPKGKDSLPSSEQKSPLLTASANHSLLANETTLTSNAAVRLETTTQNIWTLDPKDASGNNDTFAQLLGLGLDKSEISIFGVGPGMYDTDFFQVNMTGEILSKFKPGPNVDFVVQDCLTGCVPISDCIDEPPALYKRDMITQTNQVEELAYISQPKKYANGVGADMMQVKGRYSWDQTSGAGVTIYMVDTGAYQFHEEFVDIRRTWEYAGPDYGRDVEGYYPDPTPGDVYPCHGTAILSKIAGKQLGVVKNPFVVIVRINPRKKYGPVSFLEQIDWILQDWEQKKRAERLNPTGRAPMGIISMSVRFRWLQQSAPSREEKNALTKIANRFNEAIAAGLLPLAASGNNGGPVDSWPALYKSTTNWDPIGRPLERPPVPQLVVVGATNNLGQQTEWSGTADFVDLTAPGYEVKLASYLGSDKYKQKVNACAAAAGLSAYFAGLASFLIWDASTPASQCVTDVRNMLVDYAYPRALGSAQYPKGVWNGNTYLPAQQPDYAAVCGYVETANPKRDDICAYEPFASSSISSSTSVPSPSQPLRKYTSSTTSTSIKQSPTPSSTNQGIYTDATFSNSSIFVSLNQTAMITSLGKILSDICPPYAQQNHCSNQTMVISDVYSSIDGTMYRGEVNVWVDDSSYTSEARRSSMLILDSTTMAQAASRCTNVTWSLGNCAEEETTIVGREVGGDLPCIAQPPIYMCSYPSNVLVMTFEENNPNHWDYINLFVQFETQENQESICAELSEALQFDQAMMALLPEFDVLWIELRAELGEATAICEDVERTIEFVDDSS